MLSLLSTLGGLLISGLPKLLDYFQSKADQKHELAMAQLQTEREMALAAQGFAAQAKIEEIRTDQIQMQTDSEMTKAAYEHDAKVLEKAASWVSSFVGTVRPVVTYLFVAELIMVNMGIGAYVWTHKEIIKSVDDLLKICSIIFDEQEMSMLGAIIGYWFGSRGFSKK